MADEQPNDFYRELLEKNSMKDLLKEAKEKKKISKPERQAINLEDVLVFAECNKIFVLDNDFSIKEIASRDDWVRALCSHNGQLYDAGDYNKIFETLTNKEIASRNNWVGALCSHNGQLYDAGNYKKIFETLTNKEIASRDDWVWALCSHNGQLYDAGAIRKYLKH